MKPYYLWLFDSQEGVFYRSRGYNSIRSAERQAAKHNGFYQVRDRYNYIKSFNE